LSERSASGRPGSHSEAATESLFPAILNGLLQHVVIPGSSHAMGSGISSPGRMRLTGVGLATMESFDGELCRTGRVAETEFDLCCRPERQGVDAASSCKNIS